METSLRVVLDPNSDYVEIASDAVAPVCSLAHLRAMKRAADRPRDRVPADPAEARGGRSRRARFQAGSRASAAWRQLLACRRSWVRIPSAALEKACVCRSFSCTQSSAGASASPGTEWGLTDGPPPESLEKSSLCRHLLMTRTPDLSAHTEKVEGSMGTRRCSNRPASQPPAFSRRGAVSSQIGGSAGPRPTQRSARAGAGPLLSTKGVACDGHACVKPHRSRAVTRRRRRWPRVELRSAPTGAFVTIWTLSKAAVRQGRRLIGDLERCAGLSARVSPAPASAGSASGAAVASPTASLRCISVSL
jgi:hypothetical protein